MAVIKIETNIPIRGTLQYADYAPTKNPGMYQDQIKLKGNFNGDSAANVYLGLPALDQLVALGIVQVTGGQDRSGNPEYKVVRRANIEILRKEAGGNKKETTITDLGGGGAAAPAGAPAAQRGRAPSSPQQQPQGQESPGATFKRLKLLMEKCMNTAKEIYGYPEAAPPVEIMSSVAATAHSLFIECNKRNVLPSLPREPDPPATVEQKELVDKLVQHLQWDDVTFKTALAKCSISDLDKLTSPQTQALVVYLEQAIADQQRAQEEAQQAQAAAGQTGSLYSGGGKEGDIPF